MGCCLAVEACYQHFADAYISWMLLMIPPEASMCHRACLLAVLRATDAAVRFAGGQYEAAAEGFKHVLSPGEDESGLEELVLPNDRDCRAWACYAAKAYASVQDWDQLQSWLTHSQV